MAFDKKKYDDEYRKKHYIQKIIRLKPDFDREIADFLYWHQMSFNELVVKSIREYLDREYAEK